MIELDSNTSKISHTRYWKCKCDCGNILRVSQTHLTIGKTKSCGCNHFQIRDKHPSWKGFGEVSGTFFNTIRYGAKIRDMEFKITPQKIWELFLKQNRKCELSGLELKFSKYSGGNDGTASLDRIDNLKGYTIDNVRWIHKDLNIMKMDLSDEKLLEYCKLICINKKLL